MESNVKYTQRVFLTNIANGIVTDAETSYAATALEKMDAANAARKAKPSKKAVENAPRKDAIYAVLTNEPQTASDLSAILGPEFSIQRVSTLCVQMVKEGRIASTDVKVKGKGTQKGYTVIA